MLDDLNRDNYQSDLPTGKAKIPKFLYITVIFLLILILFIFGFNLYLKKTKEIKNSQTTNQTDSTLISSQEAVNITKKTQSWISSQKNEEGIYRFGCECLDEFCQQCKQSVYSPRVIPFVLWSKFKYAESSSNFNDFVKEVELSQNSVKEHSLQYSGWNCKLLYETWKSDSLSQTTKDQIKNICIKSEYEFEDGLKLPSNLDQTLLTNIKNIKTNKPLSEVSNQDQLKNFFYNNSFLVSEMVTRHLWSEITHYVYLESNLSETDLAKIYFDKALKGYFLKEKLGVKENAVLGIAAIDMYKLTKDETYLDFSKYLLNLKPEIGNNSSYNLIYQALLARELAIVSQDKSYESIFKTTVSNIVKYNKSNSYQEGAFKAPSEAFYLTENSLISGLISML